MGLTPAPREVALYDEDVEPLDFNADDDVIGITGCVVRTR